MDEGAGRDDAPYAVGARVSHDEFGAGVVTERSGHEVVVLFDDVGYRTLDAALVRDKQLLRSARGPRRRRLGSGPRGPASAAAGTR